MPRKDYYQILGVNQNATNSEIKRTYKKLSSQLHPDKITGREQTKEEEEKLINVLEAYEVLIDPIERKKYDLYIGKYAAEDENTELIDLNYVEEIKKLIQDCLGNSGIEKEEILALNSWLNDNSESKSEKEEFIIDWEKTLALLTSKLSIEVEVENTKSDIAAKCNMLLKVINDTAEKKRNINDFLEEVNKEMNKEPQVKLEFLVNEWSTWWKFQKYEEAVRGVYSDLKNHGNEKSRRENERNLLRLDRFKDDLSKEIEKTRKELKKQSEKMAWLIKSKKLARIEKFLEIDVYDREDKKLIEIRKVAYENYQTEIQNLLAEKPFLQAKQELDDLIKKILTSEENFEEHLEKLNEFKDAEAETLKNKAWREVNGQTILIELINWKQKQGQDRQEMEDKLIVYTQELMAKEDITWSQLETTTKYWQSFQHYPPLNSNENSPKKKLEKHQLTRDASPLLIEELLSKSVEIIISEEEGWEGEEEIYDRIEDINRFLKTTEKKLENKEDMGSSRLSFLKKILYIRERFFWIGSEWEANRAWEKTQKLANNKREDKYEERLIFTFFQFWSRTKNKYASQYNKEAEKWLDDHNQKKKVVEKILEENPISEPEGTLSVKRQITLNYLNNLIVEAAKNSEGDYSSLSTEKFHSPNSLKTSKNKVLRGEIDYSEAELNSLDSQEKMEKKLTQVAKTIFYYVGHLKGGSGQPGEARQILNSFAELLKEEIVSETGLAFSDWLSEWQNKLEKGKSTTAQETTESKPKISESIGNNNDITENNQKTSQTPVLDKNEATNNISENQTPEPRTSTSITDTENHADDNSLPQHLIDLDKYKNLWELVKNATQLQELNSEELKDENIDQLQLENVATFSIWWNKKLNLKYARDLKKELLTQGFTDEELTSELQERENLRPGPEKDWYCLFESQKHQTRKKDEISAIIIKELSKNVAWKKFFAEKGITDPDHQKKWKQTRLSPLSDQPGTLPQTERAWQNGWHDLTGPNISVEKSHSGEIEYFYQETIKGETKENFLRIKLYLANHLDVAIFLDLINKINKVKNLVSIATIEVSDELPALLKKRIIERKENKTREIQEIWKHFFQIHPAINTTAKKQAWIKSGLNPTESLPGKADSETDIGWGNGWTDLTINSPNDGIGKIERTNDGRYNYRSYGWSGGEFDSLRELITEQKKDDLDKENFWKEFNLRHKNFAYLPDNKENRDKAEKWRQKGYLPLEAAEYSYNCWNTENEAAAKNDPLYSGQAWYSDRWINMNISKKELIIDELKKKKLPITEQESASQSTTHLNTDWEEHLRTAKNFEELNNQQETIQQTINDLTKDKDYFWEEFAKEINANDDILETEEIMTYYGKINTGRRAAEVYQAGINANELDENGSLNFEGKVYKLNDLDGLNNYLWDKQQQLATEIAAENQKYDDILNRINNATTEAWVEIETNNINNLDPNKLTGDRNIRNLENIQADRKNVLYVPPRQDEPQEEDTNDTNLPKPEEEIDSDSPPIEIPLEENTLDQPKNEPLSKKTIAVMIVIGALTLGVVSVGVENWLQKPKKLKTSKDTDPRRKTSFKKN
jgi:curved DNA-binding protein CbpA